MKTLQMNYKKITLLCLVILTGMFQIASLNIDSDTWFILNNGRYILENGIPDINPFTMHENLPIIISQPLTACLEYVLYQNVGILGLYLWVVLFVGMAGLTTYHMAKSVLPKNNTNSSVTIIPALISFFAVFIGFYRFWTNRPQLVSISILAVEIWAIEQYEATGKKRYLWLLPLSAWLMANIHGSFYMATYLPILAHIGSTIFQKLIELVCRITKTKDAPVLFIQNKSPIRYIFGSSVLMLFTGLLNPYTLDGNLYLVKSMDIATQYTIIQELAKPILPSGLTFWYLCIVVCGIFHILRHGRNISGRHFFLWLGGNLTYLIAIRNFWIAILFSIPLLTDWLLSEQNALEKGCSVVKRISENKKMMPVLVTLCIIVALFIPSTYRDNYGKIADSHSTPVKAVEYLQSQNVPQDTNIYTHFNNGAFIEWYGKYKTYIDARPELYGQGDCTVYADFYDIYRSAGDPELFLEKYPFDYALVAKEGGEALLRYYLEHSTDWILVLQTDSYLLYKCQ